MPTISQRELRNGSAAVVDGVEAGQTYTITRNGVPVAELRPIGPRPPPTAAELVRLAGTLPPVDGAAMRREADEFFDDSTWDDPFVRPREP